MSSKALQKRARRALERQLEYQRRKAAWARGHEPELIAGMIAQSQEVRAKLERVQPIAADAKVLEVGCGGHGHIFYFGAGEAVGVDPLADHYVELFPEWQGRVRMVAAPGEQLPFANESFDVILCDNVVDHAENPRRIMEEIARVLKPGGMLFFGVHIHHPLYHAAASIHAAWRALGIPFEITPFADHTVHLTRASARRLFDQLPLRIVHERDTVQEVRRALSSVPSRHAGDWLKRYLFKNAQYEVIALRE